MLICDHLRPKFAPQDRESYSWKFIDEAVKRGELPDKTDYLISKLCPQKASAQPSASDKTASVSGGVVRAPIKNRSAPIRTTRTPFTAEDDRILTDLARRNLYRAKANGIYQELEKIVRLDTQIALTTIQGVSTSMADTIANFSFRTHDTRRNPGGIAG